MSSNNRNRRWAGGVGMAVGAAFTAALIGLANAPAATADTEPDPYQDLFGDTGINTWTPSADTDLGALAGGFDTSVDNFNAAIPGHDPFTALVDTLDPSAFSADPFSLGGLPVNAIGDFAVGLDYTLFASGIGWALDPILYNLVDDVLFLLSVF